MKKAVSCMLLLVLSLCFFTTGVFANTATPQTGDRAASLVPLFIGLIVVALAAIIVCLVLLKKKK